MRPGACSFKVKMRMRMKLKIALVAEDPYTLPPTTVEAVRSAGVR
jgi:hypothetical protein